MCSLRTPHASLFCVVRRSFPLVLTALLALVLGSSCGEDNDDGHLPGSVDGPGAEATQGGGAGGSHEGDSHRAPHPPEGTAATGSPGFEGDWGDGDGDASGDFAGEPPPEDPNAPDPDDPEENPWDPEEEEKWNWYQLSPDDSTSMATAQLLKSNARMRGMALREHEVINYYDPPATYRDEETFPRSWETPEGFSLAIDARRADGDADGIHNLELLIHAYAPLPPEATRRPWTLHLCVDVSGSMRGDRIIYTRDALRRLVEAMRPGDRVSLTTFESTGRLVLSTREVAEHRAEILQAIDGLVEGGGTNMRDGLDIAYAEAQEHLDAESIHRVLLFSDGAANVGDTDIERFAALTSSQHGEGIYLSGIGVGNDYDFARMNAITDAGRGAHVFLPSAEEVAVIFGPMLRKIIEVAADEISIEVLVPEELTLADFSGEEVSDNPQERVQNIVLAAGDDFTLLADFVTTDESAFTQDLWFIFRYTPLGGEAQVHAERIPIADLLELTNPLLDRTRLIQRYGRWGIAGLLPANSDAEPREDGCALRDDILAFSPSDDGLAEIASVIERRAGCN